MRHDSVVSTQHDSAASMCHDSCEAKIERESPRQYDGSRDDSKSYDVEVSVAKTERESQHQYKSAESIARFNMKPAGFRCVLDTSSTT